MPATGGLLALVFATRTAALVVGAATFLVQALVIAVAAVQLTRLDRAVDGDVVPGCDTTAASDGATMLLAQCVDWFPAWGFRYEVATSWTTLAFAALATLLTGCAVVFSWWARRERAAALQGLLWLTGAALCGLFVARDLVLFYVFFELMLVPLLVLVGVWGGADRVRATMTMFIYTLAGSLLMLVGVIATGVYASRVIGDQGEDGISAFSLPDLAQLAADGDLQLPWWVLASFLIAFAIKAPLLPVHGWLPVAYREAPAEVTAVLSGLVSKAAFFGLLVIVLPLFPHLLADGWATGIAVAAVASLLYGSFAAFRQPDARGVVAYSSLAQMGLIVLGLSTLVGDGGEQGVSGATLQALNHGLVSALLFLLVGIVEHRTGERELARMGGLATGRPRLASIGLVATLIALAVPGATTFAGELLVIAGAFRLETAGPLLATLAALAIVLAAMYALRFVAGIVFVERVGHGDTGVTSPRDLHGAELVMLLPLVLVLLALSAWPDAIRRATLERPVPFAMITSEDRER